jgi:hypothetical protein
MYQTKEMEKVLDAALDVCSNADTVEQIDKTLIIISTEVWKKFVKSVVDATS